MATLARSPLLALPCKALRSTDRLRVKVRPFPKYTHALARASGVAVVVRGRVECLCVEPEGDVVQLPLEPHLKVVVLVDQLRKQTESVTVSASSQGRRKGKRRRRRKRTNFKAVLEQEVGLVFGHAVDALGERLIDEQTLPAGDCCPHAKETKSVFLSHQKERQREKAHEMFESRGERHSNPTQRSPDVPSPPP